MQYRPLFNDDSAAPGEAYLLPRRSPATRPAIPRRRTWSAPSPPSIARWSTNAADLQQLGRPHGRRRASTPTTSAEPKKTPTGSRLRPVRRSTIASTVRSRLASLRIRRVARSPSSTSPARPTAAQFEPLADRPPGVFLRPGRLRLPGSGAVSRRRATSGDATRLRIELPADGRRLRPLQISRVEIDYGG